jgi:hypothetical protein
MPKWPVVLALVWALGVAVLAMRVVVQNTLFRRQLRHGTVMDDPILWFGFRRMSADRELACDELALSVVGESEGPAYGQTIVKLLEACSEMPALPGLVGILEDKSQIFQRVSMIAQFKKHPRWSLVGAVASVILGLATLTGAQTKKAPEPSRPDLTGTVRMTNGQPASATVFIYTARPRVGTSPFCPSCYPDCNKSAKADSQGQFKIESLDPQLLFRLLVVGENCKPAFVTNVDPGKEPISVTLEPQDLAHVPPDCMVRGRLVDSKGAPVKHATVEGRMALFKNGIEQALLRDIDPLAVSDERGQFVLTARRPLATITLVVDAPGYAKRSFTDVPGGGQSRDFQMTEGATLKGRVMRDGKPLPNVSVRTVSENRMDNNFAGNYEVGTDTNGQFMFLNLPPNVRYQVYGLMKTLGEHDATKVIVVEAGGDGSVTDAGNLEVFPAHHLSGRVVLADGKPIPPKTQLMIGREDAWDSVLVDLGTDGAFSVGGIPSGTINLIVRLPGYHVSAKNDSFDSLNPNRLMGRVNQNIAGLVVLMEKGPMLDSHFDNDGNGMDLPENRPLAGAERAGGHSRQRSISGQVTDKETGQPIASFRITPGRASDFRGNNWNPQFAVDGTNGAYVVYLNKGNGEPLLQIESPGYMPMSSPKLLPGQNNFDFALTKGAGPSGVVLLPDGKPAADASVGLICPADDMPPVNLRAGGELRAFRHQELVGKTDSAGHFSFGPELEMNYVAAASPAGFKMVSIDSLKTNGQITLDKWGTIKGVLRRAGRPSTNETLDLTFGGALKETCLNLFIQAVTDEKGAFEFDNVPPVDCEILASSPSEQMPRALNTIKTLRVDPGQTAEITIDAAEMPVIDVKRIEAFQRRFDTPSSKTLTGIVVLPNGKPAADAQVGFSDQQHELHIGDGELVAGPMNPNSAHSDASGAFTVPWPGAATALYAASEEGVARLKIGGLTNGMRIVLQQWARVEGTIRLNHRPAAGEQIRLHLIDFGGQDWQGYRVDTTVDANGHFEIAHVFPGVCGIGRWINLGHGSRSINDSLTFELAPGGSTNITWGGDGRPVTGTLELTATNDLPGDIHYVVSIHNNSYPVPPRAPGSLPRPLGFQELQKWRQTPEGMAAVRAYRDYRAPVTADNTFQADEVLPGHYIVTVNANYSSGPRNLNHVTAETSVTNVDVPPLADPEKSEPYDLGRVMVKLKIPAQSELPVVSKAPKAGEAAPDFTTQTLDGKSLKLADYRGKFVLLDFRYMLPGGEMEGLQSVNDKFGKDDRFVTISLCQNADDDYVKQLKSNGANHWVMGNLDFTTMGESYGLGSAGFPVIILVGPDGKILASGLHGEAIYASVAKALGR